MMRGWPRHYRGAVLSLHRLELVEGSKGWSLFCFPLGPRHPEGEVMAWVIISWVGGKDKEGWLEITRISFLG